MLDMLTAQGVVGGVEIAARYLPSAATQLARRSNLPEPDELSMRVEEAQDGLPFRADAFRPFIDDVAASRTMAPLLLSDISDGLIAARLQPLLFQRGHDWYGVIAPSDLRAPERFASAMRDAGATYVDVAAEANGIVAEYTGAAWRWLGLGALAALVTVAVGLREPLRVDARCRCDRRRGADDGCHPHRDGRAAVADPHRVAAVRRRRRPGLRAVLRPSAA